MGNDSKLWIQLPNFSLHWSFQQEFDPQITWEEGRFTAVKQTHNFDPLWTDSCHFLHDNEVMDYFSDHWN